MPKKNILIADDDEQIRKIFVRMLRDEDYQIYLASNGKEALDIAKTIPVDVALFDVKMPVMDGIEALKKVKKIDKLTEVIMITGYADLEDLYQGMTKLGAYDYVLKPFNFVEIKITIRNALEKRSLVIRESSAQEQLDNRIIELEREFRERTIQLRELQIRYSNIVENATDAIVIVQDGYMKFANSWAIKITGYSRDEILTIPIVKMVHPDDRKMITDFYAKRMKGEDAPPVYSFRFLKKDKSTVWVETHAVRTEWENKAAALNIIRDISERIRDQEAARESAEQYQAIFEQATDSVVLVDLNTGGLADFNESAHKSLGYTREEFKGIKLSNIDALESSAAVRKRIKKFIKDKQLTFQTKHRKKDGEVRDIDVRGRVISLSGKEYGLAIWRDITEENKYQETLKIKDTALATSVNGVALADLKGNLTYANEAFLSMWGYADEAEVLGMRAQKFVSMNAGGRAAIKGLLEKGIWMGQVTGIRKDGSPFYVQVSANMVKDMANQLICFMGSFQDITKQKRAEELIMRSEKLSSLGQLSAGLAHELRNPLAVISTCSQFCVDNMQLERPALENFQVIHRNAQRASSLINELLNFARPSQLDWAEVDINEVVNGVLDLVKFEQKPFHIALVPLLRKRLPKILGDGNALRQIFLNLVQNAIQAVSEKGKITVQTRFLASQGQVEVNVIDNGPGIPADYRNRVFDPFFTTKDKGTGLGLSICNSIVEQHKGDIFLGSGDAEGTKVSVRLPVHRRKKGE